MSELKKKYEENARNQDKLNAALTSSKGVDPKLVLFAILVVVGITIFSVKKSNPPKSRLAPTNHKVSEEPAQELAQTPASSTLLPQTEAGDAGSLIFPVGAHSGDTPYLLISRVPSAYRNETTQFPDIK